MVGRRPPAFAGGIVSNQTDRVHFINGIFTSWATLAGRGLKYAILELQLCASCSNFPTTADESRKG